VGNLAEREITIEFKHPEIIALIVFLSIVLFLELQVTLNSHIVFGDEGTHARMSQWMAEELEYPVWTPFGDTPLQKRGFSRPPVWNLLGGSLLFIFGNHEVILKSLTPIIGTIITGIAVFVLTKRIYNSKIAFIASIIAVTIPAFVTYSVLYYTDTLTTLYFFLAVTILVLAVKEDKKKYWILAGLFTGLAFLTKSTSFALFPVIGFCFLYQIYKRRGIVKVFKNYITLGLCIALLLLPFFIRGYFHYGYPSCNLPVFPFFSTEGCSFNIMPKQQFEYEGVTEQVGTEQSILRIGIMNYLNFAYGNVWFVVLGFLCGLTLLIWRKNRTDIIILLTILSLFIIVARDYETRAENMSRYLLGWVPIIAIVVGNYFASIYEFIAKYYKILALPVFAFVFFFSLLNLTCPWPFTTQKCQELNAGMKTDVMAQVKQFSPAFFEACDWVKENVEEDARLGHVVWAGATIYNCQRNVGGGGADVTFSNNLTLVLPLLKLQEVSHIFVQKFSISYTNQKLSEKYPISFVEFLESNPEHFEKIFENGPSIEECKQVGGCDGTILYKINYGSISN